MTYLLDTNIVIYFFRNQFNLAAKFSEIQEGNLFVSEITLAELYYGAQLSNNYKQNENLIKQFIKKVRVLSNSSSIEEFAKQKSLLRKQGNLIPDFDILIGSTAITNELVLVTQNLKDFIKLDGINIEDWTN